jgi:hypothetical protein
MQRSCQRDVRQQERYNEFFSLIQYQCFTFRITGSG